MAQTRHRWEEFFQVCKEAQSYTAGCRQSLTFKGLPPQNCKWHGSPEGWTQEKVVAMMLYFVTHISLTQPRLQCFTH